MLLSQHDGDGDGRLDLVRHRGFEHDPAASSLAQRFADRVIERDEIVREDAPDEGDSVADEEIHSLVAIPVYMQDDFEGVVVCANRPGGFEELDDEVLLSLGDHAGAVLQNHQLQGRVRSSYLAVVRMLADAIEAKDPFVRAQSDEISACVERVARRLDLAPDAAERLVFAGLLRDVGKLGISDRVLLKPGPLDADERRIAQLHPLIGARIVERVPGLAGLAPAIRHHHERWDGGGLSERPEWRGDPARGAGDRGCRRLLGPHVHPPLSAAGELGAGLRGDRACRGNPVRSPGGASLHGGDAPAGPRRGRRGHDRRDGGRARRTGRARSRGAAARPRLDRFDRPRDAAVVPPLPAGGGTRRGATSPAPPAALRRAS